MGKRARNEDATEDGNPFAKAGRKKAGQLGGQVQHTVKYCVWELLREQPAGLSVEDLLHEMQSRELRSFANSTKPVSQMSVELNRAKDYFKQDASTKRWSLRAGSAEARKPFPAEGTTSDAMLVCRHPVDQQESGAAADLQSPPAGQLEPAAETAAAQAFATDAASVAVPSDEEVGTGASVIPQLSSAEHRGTAAARHSVNVQQDIRRTPQGQCQGEGTEMEEQAAGPVSTQAASDPMSATFSTCNAPVSVASQPQLPSAQQSEPKQPSAGLQSSTLVSGSGVLDIQSGCTDVGNAGASAVAPPFIQSPRTGVVRAIHSSPASPDDDMVAQQRPVFGAQLGKEYVASPLGPPPQQQTCSHTDGKPAVIPDSAGRHAQADAPSPKEQLGKPACGVQSRNLQSAAAAPAAGDSKAQPTAQGIQVAIIEMEPAREADPLGSSTLEGALPAEQMEEAACAATSHDNAKEDASMPEAVEVRWVPSPEWTSGEAPGEQQMAHGDSALAPLLGSLPWPFPTLYPSTPEREAQPQRPRDALDAPQPIPPNLLDTHSVAPLPPVKSSMQPVFLLEDGEPSLLGAAALPSPAVLTPPSNAAPPLPSASLVPLSIRKSGAGSIGTLNGPTDSVSPCEPAPQLPAAAESRAPAGIAGQESVTVWGVGAHSIGGATADAHEAAGLTTGTQAPPDSAHRHPSSAEPASELPHERYQTGTRHRSSEGDRDGRRPSYSDRDRRSESREQERADEKRGRLGEKRYERARDRDRQESVRDHDARRERQQDYAREYGSRTENADTDRRREHKQGPLRSRSRERDRPACRAHEDARLPRKRDDRGDYHDRYRDGRGRDDSHADRHVESGRRSREGSRPDDRIKDPPRSPWHDGLRKQRPCAVERESSHGVNRRGPGQPRSRSGTRELGPPDDSCPFEAGRVIGCSEAAEAGALKRMTFGSDLRKDLEGIDARTAVFLWNYDRGRLHGIFRGSSKDVVTEPTGRDDPYLYEIRVHNFATYRSLPLEVVRRIVPTNGHTHKGRQLLKTRIDRGTVAKLCREFGKKR